MRLASYFENNATAVQEKVKIVQKRLLHPTWAGLVSSKTLHERLSHVWVLFQLDCAVLHWGDPMHRFHCSSTRAVCSLREPFVTSLNRQHLPPEVLPCLCLHSDPASRISLSDLHLCSILVSNQHQQPWDSLGIAPVLVSLPAFQFSWANCVHLGSLCPWMVTRGKITA